MFRFPLTLFQKEITIRFFLVRLASMKKNLTISHNVEIAIYIHEDEQYCYLSQHFISKKAFKYDVIISMDYNSVNHVV